jgi:hypothetical protein
VACLERKIIDDEDLTALAVHNAAYDALRERMRDVRAEISNGGGNGEAHQSKVYSPELREKLQQSLRGFLQRPMMDGTLLENATREVLLSDAERYENYAEGNAREGRFLRAVAKKVPDEKKVKDVFSEQQLQRLYDRAKKG